MQSPLSSRHLRDAVSLVDCNQRDAVGNELNQGGIGGETLRSEQGSDDRGPFRLKWTKSRVLLFGLFVVASLIGLYYLLPELAGLDKTWKLLKQGRPVWLLVCLLFTLGSFGGYVLLFRAVYIRGGARFTLRESYQITMAGLAATRIFAAGGAGGIALTVWALRRAGVPARTVADKTLSFLVLTYIVYLGSVIVFGTALYFGIFSAPRPFAISLLPASIALAISLIVALMALVPRDFERRLHGFAQRKGRLGRWAQGAAHAPAVVSAGVRDAVAHIRSGDPAVLGALAFWGCQVGVMWASFYVFGKPPAFGVVVVAFFIGMVGNLLPLPGGIGGVDGGLIGALVAFHVPAGQAVVVVLCYRAFIFWLPTIPGAIAYFQLRKTVGRWGVEGLSS